MAHTKQDPSTRIGTDQADGVLNCLTGESELENIDRQAGHQYLPMDVYIDSKTMDEHFHASSIHRRWTKIHQSTS
jgi:hypothetical protein